MTASKKRTTDAEPIVKSVDFARDIEKDIKQELARSFWQIDVSSQQRPKHHRK